MAQIQSSPSTRSKIKKTNGKNEEHIIEAVIAPTSAPPIVPPIVPILPINIQRQPIPLPQIVEPAKTETMDWKTFDYSNYQFDQEKKRIIKNNLIILNKEKSKLLYLNERTKILSPLVTICVLGNYTDEDITKKFMLTFTTVFNFTLKAEHISDICIIKKHKKNISETDLNLELGRCIKVNMAPSWYQPDLVSVKNIYWVAMVDEKKLLKSITKLHDNVASISWIDLDVFEFMLIKYSFEDKWVFVELKKFLKKENC